MRIKAAARRILTPTLALALAVALAATASAQPRSLDEIGRAGGVPDLKALVKQAVSGQVPPEVTVEKLEGGLTKIAVPLRPDSPVLRQTKAKDLINCSLTVDFFEPDLFADTVSFDVAPLDLFEYFVGWVTLNTSNNDIDATSSIKTKGPGPDVNSGNQVITYDAASFVLLFLSTTDAGFDGFETGLHSIDAKVKGAKPGKLKGNFCAGCT